MDEQLPRTDSSSGRYKKCKRTIQNSEPHLKVLLKLCLLALLWQEKSYEQFNINREGTYAFSTSEGGIAKAQ